MRKLISKALAGILTIGGLTGCTIFSSQPEDVTPPFEFVSALTANGNGAVVLIMRPYSHAVTSAEIIALRNELRVQYPQFAYSRPGGPSIVVDTPPTISGPTDSKVVAFGYAIYNDREATSFIGNSNAKGTAPVYDNAQKWFIEQLATSGSKMPGWLPG